MMHRMAASGRAPQTIQFAQSISGVATDFVITDFGTELFIVITQSCKIGSLIQASASELKEGENGSSRVYEVQVLFGDRRAEHYRAYARALIELVASRSSKSVLLGIALKEHSTEGFRQVLQELRGRLGPVTAPPDEEDDLL
mmetsp:Transcript_96099/g.310296  ORF Transcript_96099/g.310296 Transcript_96099/m.310296 type:complete len:142 (+) Transcript_96099:41-466(+)